MEEKLKLLQNYARATSTSVRSLNDLSPLELWLLDRLTGRIHLKVTMVKCPHCNNGTTYSTPTSNSNAVCTYCKGSSYISKN